MLLLKERNKFDVKEILVIEPTAEFVEMNYEWWLAMQFGKGGE